MRKKLKDFSEGSLYSNGDRDKAARMVAKGEIVGIFNRGVCALWFDGENVNAVKKVWQVKGEGRRGRPIALTLSLDEFVKMVDSDTLPPNERKFLTSPDLKFKIGSLCFIRAPIQKNLINIIPHHARSFDENGVCMIQNWDSFGHTPSEKFLSRVKTLGVRHPAVTSMNITGQPEIVDQEEGALFCRKFNIPLFLRDPKAHPKHFGSYTIFTFNSRGIILERDGNIPGKLFKKIFDLPINTKNAKFSKHPQLNFPYKIFNTLSAIQLRAAILWFLKGERPAWIKAKVAKYKNYV